MKYISTRDASKAKLYSFSDAVLAGWADDGGMLLPESFPDVSKSLGDLSKLSYPELCLQILSLYAGEDIPAKELKVRAPECLVSG